MAIRRGFQLEGRSLREHVARGTLVNAAFLIALSALGLLRGFILAAFLTRTEYGVWGVLIVTLGTLLLLKQVGVSDKYVQQDDADQETAFQKAFSMEAAFTGLVMAALAALLPVLVLVYGKTELVAPGLVLLTVLPAGALQMPIWAYYRRMEFLTQRSLLAVEPVVAFVVSVALAIAGAGYWSFVIGLAAGAWAGAVAAIRWSPYRLRLRFDKETLRSYAGFSWPLFVSVVSALVIAQSSLVATQAFVGLAGVGAVTLATTISQFTERVDTLVTSTLYPAIAAVRERMDLLYESFVKSNRLALMWAVPFGIGLSLFCSDLVTFAIGEKWRPAVILLQVFGVAAAVGHVGFNWDAYFRAVGRTRPIAVTSAAAAVVFVSAAIPLLAAYGLEGLAAAIALQTLVHVVVRAYYLSRLFHGFGFIRHAVRAFLPAVPGALLVLLARLLEPAHRTAAMALVELVLYVLVTVAATVLFEGRLLREALGYLRRTPDREAAAT